MQRESPGGAEKERRSGRAADRRPLRIYTGSPDNAGEDPAQELNQRFAVGMQEAVVACDESPWAGHAEATAEQMTQRNPDAKKPVIQ